MRAPILCACVLALTACPSKPPEPSLLDGGMLPSEGDDAMGSMLPPPDAAPSVFEIGYPMTFSGSRTVFSNDFIAVPIQVSAGQAGEIINWGLRLVAAPAGTQVRMALYSHDAGPDQPGTLITQSPPWTVTTNEQLASGFELTAGTYWLAISASSQISISRNNATPQTARDCSRTLSFTTPFPTSWGSASCFTTGPTNLYLRIRRTQ